LIRIAPPAFDRMEPIGDRGAKLAEAFTADFGEDV